MSSSNLLEPLVSVIETIRQRISEHGATLRENETRTRVALIDPILQALGWDVSDPTVVTPEFPVSASRADYALLGPGGNALSRSKRRGWEKVWRHTDSRWSTTRTQKASAMQG